MTGLITKLRTAIHVLKSVTTLLRHAVQLIQALQTAQSSWAAARA